MNDKDFQKLAEANKNMTTKDFLTKLSEAAQSRQMINQIVLQDEAKKHKEVKGTKYDDEKPDLSLIPREPLWELARVLMAGEKKYGRWNWKNGLEIQRLLSASMRHITQFNEGENLDKETSTNHLMNACANLFFAFWMLQNKPEMDNRPKNDNKA